MRSLDAANSSTPASAGNQSLTDRLFAEVMRDLRYDRYLDIVVDVAGRWVRREFLAWRAREVLGSDVPRGALNAILTSAILSLPRT